MKDALSGKESAWHAETRRTRSSQSCQPRRIGLAEAKSIAALRSTALSLLPFFGAKRHAAALSDEYSKPGVPQISSFELHPRNMKEFCIFDLHGNLLRFGCALEEIEER